VGENLVEKLVQSKDDMFLENERKEITVLFADIRSFTSISEKMAAEEVVSMLNQFFDIMVDIIFKYNGVLDKFVGDQLMAIFGLVPSANHHSFDAISAAIEMQEATERLMKERTSKEKETFGVGIGINTGSAIVGNVGSHNRMNYTAIGDSVNVASRLQQIAKSGEIITGKETCNQAKECFKTVKKGNIQVKNRMEPLEYYSILR
jgi:class 3 adenylate cyclase